MPLIRHPLSPSEVQDDLEETNRTLHKQALQDERILSSLGMAHLDGAREIMQYDPGVDIDEDSDTDDIEDENDEDGGRDLDEQEYQMLQKDTRVQAAQRIEGNRRKGGIMTQISMVKAWNEFVEMYQKNGKIKDDIVDEHSMLLFLDYSASRPKKTTRGIEIPGTFIGAAQIKKLFFGALRVRKLQEAEDPSLQTLRPIKNSKLVFDSAKCRMDEAIKRIRRGDVGPDEDAPDITFNTFLNDITDDERDAIGRGILSHRELRSTVHGHVAWTTQNASGNRGDDIRSIKLAEIQPYTLLHPDGRTQMTSVIAMQGEEKAGLKGMKTSTNPVYTVWIGHREPEKCPLGAIILLLHYCMDVRGIERESKIDWAINKSWRRIRLLQNAKNPELPYSEQSLYRLYSQAFKKAGFASRMKQHLARHMLPYAQANLGVAYEETSRLGWKRGHVFHDTYAPSLPKAAILAGHGYREDETYDPIWRHVPVPSQFTKLVCPMAEANLAAVRGRDNLGATARFWELAIKLRPYLFQCGAAIFQTCPTSAIFKLPAFVNEDVQRWMKHSYPHDLALRQAKAGEPIAIERVQNELIRESLASLRSVMTVMRSDLLDTQALVHRRTDILSPSKRSNVWSALDHTVSRSFETLAPFELPAAPSAPPSLSAETLSAALPQPTSGSDHILAPPTTPFSQSDALLHDEKLLPPREAFGNSGLTVVFQSTLRGNQSWMEIFRQVKHAHLLWDVYKPSKSLEQYESVENLVNVYKFGESVIMGDKRYTKPSLEAVESEFGASWRSTSQARKTWERFREIPERVNTQSLLRGVSPSVVVTELEQLRKDGGWSLNQLKNKVKEMRTQERKSASATEGNTHSISASDAPIVQVLDCVDPEAKSILQAKKRVPPADPRKPSKRKRISA